MARSRSQFSFQTPLGILVVALCLSGCLALAAALRLENPQSLSLCHFEEGVHSASAQRLLAAGATNLDYAQPLHAPPLFPWTVAALGLAKPSSPRDGIFVSIACGALTSLAMFMVGWRLNGIGFGLAAAALLACSDLHIAVSRTGLPSAMLTLWSTLALWAAMEWAPRPLPRGATPLLSRYVFFGMLGGAFSALAWSTMYSGGLGLLIIMISLGLSWRLEAEEFEDRGPYVFIAFCLAAAIALSAFVPWYLHLQADYPGGFWGVLEHHRRQITGWLHWPEHLGRQLTALPGLRHHGWWLGVMLVTCVGLVLAWRETGWRRTMAIALALVAASLAVTAGLDALVLVCGVAGAGPALLSRRWPLVLCAVWLLMLALLVPLHFPYVKLLTPMLPAAILLSLMLIWPPPVAAAASEERLARQRQFAPRRETPAALPWLAGGLLGAAGVSLLHPFGPTPTQEVWDAWSVRSGYAQFAQRIAIETPDNAAIICQGQPPLVAYCPRQRKHLFGNVGFSRGLDGLGDDEPCYLALDFRWLYESPPEARDDVLRWLHCLSPTAVAPLQPSILMLLDHLSPPLVVAKLHTPPRPSVWEDSLGRKIPVPPNLISSSEDILVLYRVDLRRLRSELR